ncbi:hypothetical protein SAMN05444000_103126 [Shimia gijangensis]|uniref:Uncharacterized protein n=1 Tax=Shimia gijangensis TaxID=1470563 RepID=A0A1M6E6T1_9RHOB|nr:hypothetical protein [Shimia gijangensis]SHI81161.1 hypothetical protein SAMN05444000_103126 [Shimia gijangensis]
MKIAIATVAFVTALLPATNALAEQWSCSFPNQRLDAWIRGQIMVSTDGTEATVFDSLINEAHAGPIGARVTANNDKRLTAKWTLKRIELRHGFAPRIDYTLTYLKDTGRANITATAPLLEDYNNADRAGGNFVASGSCKPR